MIGEPPNGIATTAKIITFVTIGIIVVILFEIIWAVFGCPVFDEQSTISVSSATLVYMSPYAGPLSHGDCIISDINGKQYHLDQDISSKYWCLSGWNRTEEIHAGQQYKAMLSHHLFGDIGTRDIHSMIRIGD
jgi:hypothetical protein